MKLLTSALVVAVVLPVAVRVQDIPGRIDGVVTDSSGGRLPGVTVSISSPGAPAGRTVTTNAAGRFVLPQMPAGDYTLALSLSGFQTARGTVSVKPGTSSLVTFQLAVGSLSEQVTIRATGPAAPMPAPPPGRPVAPVRVGGDIREPRKVHDVRPIYPAAGGEGQVHIEAVVGRDGNVASAVVVQGVPLLNTAALDAVRQWRYTPTLLNGQPVEVMMAVTVVFVRN